MLSLSIVRSFRDPLTTPGPLTACLLPVRWGPEALNRSRAELIQSVFLWTQFYETQLHIHRMFALKEPPDPELSASSMIICMIASKQCITIVESAKEITIIPLHSCLLIVSPKVGRAVPLLNDVFPRI